MNKPIFIAEVKTKSPFNFKSKYDWEYLFELANNYGDWISIHSQADFGGDTMDIVYAKDKSKKPILAKGFHRTDIEIETCLDCGADYVLVVDRIPAEKYIDKCLIEFSQTWKIVAALNAYPEAKYVYNLRNLNTGILKKHNEFPELKTRLKNTWLCQASGIRAPIDVDPRADAFIVGSYLPEYINKLEKL